MLCIEREGEDVPAIEADIVRGGDVERADLVFWREISGFDALQWQLLRIVSKESSKLHT